MNKTIILVFTFFTISVSASLKMLSEIQTEKNGLAIEIEELTKTNLESNPNLTPFYKNHLEKLHRLQYLFDSESESNAHNKIHDELYKSKIVNKLISLKQSCSQIYNTENCIDTFESEKQKLSKYKELSNDSIWEKLDNLEVEYIVFHENFTEFETYFNEEVQTINQLTMSNKTQTNLTPQSKPVLTRQNITQVKKKNTNKTIHSMNYVATTSIALIFTLLSIIIYSFIKARSSRLLQTHKVKIAFPVENSPFDDFPFSLSSTQKKHLSPHSEVLKNFFNAIKKNNEKNQINFSNINNKYNFMFEIKDSKPFLYLIEEPQFLELKQNLIDTSDLLKSSNIQISILDYYNSLGEIEKSKVHLRISA